MSDKFFMVIREDGGAPPMKRHDTEDDAIKEANRLALSSGKPYYVMKAIGMVKLPEVEIVYEKIDN